MSSEIRIRESAVNGEIMVPGSKSHTIRALVIAGLAGGVSEIRRPLISGDTASCITALEALGVSFERGEGAIPFLRVTGCGGQLKKYEKTIDVGNSGTTLRILTAVAALSGYTTRFDGDESIRKRPMQSLLSAIHELGAGVKSNSGHAPLSVSGPLRGGKTMTDGITSQFLTALLLACPLAEKDSVIEVFDLHEKPYIEMTLKWLNDQKIVYARKGYSQFQIKGGQRYFPFTAIIPGDFSTATFPLVAAAVTGGKIVIKGLDMNDSQGDKMVFKILNQMGAAVTDRPDGISVAGGHLEGGEFDLDDIPDSLPALAVAGCAAEGETRLINVEQARLKESDRIMAMCTELRKMGADIRELDHGITIRTSELKGAYVNGHGDHRIVMALSIAGMIASGETVIANGAETVKITYPAFVEDFRNLGADICTIER